MAQSIVWQELDEHAFAWGCSLRPERRFVACNCEAEERPFQDEAEAREAAPTAVALRQREQPVHTGAGVGQRFREQQARAVEREVAHQ
jgi:hypothetical protein